MEALKNELLHLISNREISVNDYVRVLEHIKRKHTILAIIEYLRLDINKNKTKIKW